MSHQINSFTTPRTRILVSYHRDDAESHAHSLVQTLRQRFGVESVETCLGLPLADSPPTRGGTGDFTVLILVIGKRWLRLTEKQLSQSASGEAPTNKVIDLASSSTRAVIPVLVNGASMPAEKTLRGKLGVSHLSSQAMRLSDARWDQDFEKLVGGVEQLSAAGEKPKADSRGSDASSDSLVSAVVRREDAIELLIALMTNLGSPSLKGKAKYGGMGGKAGKGGGMVFRYEGYKDGKAGGGYKGGKAGGGFNLPTPQQIVVAAGSDPDSNRASEKKSVKDSPSDLVYCTVFVPETVARGERFMVQVFAHMLEEAVKVAEQARERDKETREGGSKAIDYIKRGTKLTFDLQLDEMEIDEPRQSLIWRGGSDAVQFFVGVKDTHPAGKVSGIVLISQDDITFARIGFQFTVAATTTSFDAPPTQAEQDSHRFGKAFISYDSKDRNDVLRVVQGLKRRHIEIFLDLLSLEPGELWEKSLYKHIDESDVFYLFWSRSSKRSKWVMKELRYALAKKEEHARKLPEIVPMIVGKMPPPKPPSELPAMHFNDPIAYFITEEKKPRSKPSRKKKRA